MHLIRALHHAQFEVRTPGSRVECIVALEGTLLFLGVHWLCLGDALVLLGSLVHDSL